MFSTEDAVPTLPVSISCGSTKLSEFGEIASGVVKLLSRWRGVACISSASPELDMSDALQV